MLLAFIIMVKKNFTMKGNNCDFLYFAKLEKWHYKICDGLLTQRHNSIEGEGPSLKFHVFIPRFHLNTSLWESQTHIAQVQIETNTHRTIKSQWLLKMIFKLPHMKSV